MTSFIAGIVFAASLLACSGALLSSDQGMLELRHGVADIGAITPIHTRGTLIHHSGSVR